MGKGKALSDEERGPIMGMHEAGVAVRAIARAVKRPRDAVQRALNSHDRQCVTGRPPILSDRALCLLVRMAASGEYSATQLQQQLKLQCSARTVRRVLQCVDWLSYTKTENTLQLFAEYKMR